MKMYRTLNPYNGKLINEFECHDSNQINEALENAVSAQKTWANLSLEQRKDCIIKLSEYLINNSSQFAQTASIEMGKPITQAMPEVEKSAWLCEHTALNAQKYLKDIEKDYEQFKAKVIMQPLGVVLGIMPWNFPYWQVYRYAIPALMAGNVVILKHAPNVPQCALNIQKSFDEVGFPKGCFTNLFLTNEQVSTLIKDDKINAVTFTGSMRGGSAIAKQASENIKKSVLELGGCDPFIVLKDADLDTAAKLAVKGRFNNAGQVCIAAKRWIVEDEIYDTFKQKLIEETAKLQIGNPLETSTNLGPLSRKDILEGVDLQVKESVKKGAIIAYQKSCSNTNGYFYPPTILENLQSGMPAYDEEVFGPVACLFKVKNIEDAIDLANDTPYGLGASVFTKNKEMALNIASKIETGNVAINGIVSSHPDLPFGGVKKSGYGRELGIFGMREFVNVKTITIR